MALLAAACVAGSWQLQESFSSSFSLLLQGTLPGKTEQSALLWGCCPFLGSFCVVQNGSRTLCPLLRASFSVPPAPAPVRSSHPCSI